jgi:DNA-binding XRE family transcriptional regulator
VVGYTQERLAEMLGVERTTVVRWEAGETCPQPWYRPKLAKALAVSVEELGTMLVNGELVEDSADLADGLPDDAEYDPVLASRWNHRGNVEAAVVLGGGDRVKRRYFVFLSGMALTAPAHQWLVHEPGPLVSGLSGRRVSAELADRLPPMIAELRAMDDVAGGGMVLSLTQNDFGWVAGSWIRPPTMNAPAGSCTLPSLNLASLPAGQRMMRVSRRWHSAITSLVCGRRTLLMTGHSVRTS